MTPPDISRPAIEALALTSWSYASRDISDALLALREALDQHNPPAAPEPVVGIRSLTAYIDCGGGARSAIPDPRAFRDGGLEWCLRYSCKGVLPNNVQFQAASVVESFDYLLSTYLNMKEAIDRLRILRRGRAALIAEAKAINLKRDAAWVIRNQPQIPN